MRVEGDHVRCGPAHATGFELPGELGHGPPLPRRRGPFEGGGEGGLDGVRNCKRGASALPRGLVRLLETR